MKIPLRAIDLDAIRIDGGTQVRERLDEEWVTELMSLYVEDHEIEPVLVVLDPAGNHWLSDGFHRHEAQRRLGRSTVKATVRDGPAATLDMAKMLAAEANKNGRPLQSGDKRRAVLMARSTPEGAKMGATDLARHCGVTRQYVYDVLNGGEVPRKVVDKPHPQIHAKHYGGAPRSCVGDLWKKVDKEIDTNPDRSNTEIADVLACDRTVVARRRSVLGQPRRERGPSSRREKSHTEPSAPSRKGGDVRDRAEVISAHPPSAPAPETDPVHPAPAAPTKPEFTGPTARDTVNSVVRQLCLARDEMRRAWDTGVVMASDWGLLLDIIRPVLGQLNDLVAKDKP